MLNLSHDFKNTLISKMRMMEAISLEMQEGMMKKNSTQETGAEALITK